MRHKIDISVIIPTRNEEALIAGTLDAVLTAVGHFTRANTALLQLADSPIEVIVVDNISTDDTYRRVMEYVRRYGVKCISCRKIKAPCARNAGYEAAKGDVLVFIDADTRIPPDALNIIWQHYIERKLEAGIFRLASLEGGMKATFWWMFWEHVRRLPLSRAKAMPAFMFCSREVFETFGPFDEQVEIAEEWPILARLYKQYPEKFIYDRTLTAFSSDRRMALQRFGYLKTFFKYIWVILHPAGRKYYTNSIRHTLEEM